MKKIICILLLLLATITTFAADDLTKDQTSLQNDVIKFLQKEGYTPEFDSDGDVSFKRDGKTYRVIIHPKWEDPFLITLFLNFSYSGDWNAETMKNAAVLLSNYKGVKLQCKSISYEYRMEMFCLNSSGFKASFNRLLNELDEARDHVDKMVELGVILDLTGDKNKLFDKAMDFYKKKEYKKSFPLFKLLADENYPKAFGYMGLSYEMGFGTEKDRQLMVEYYEKAITAIGEAWCAWRLGKFQYDNADYEKALENFNKCGAVANGMRSDALYMAGLLYEEGKGTPIDRQQAVARYRKSVEYATTMKCKAREALVRMSEPIEKISEFRELSKAQIGNQRDWQLYEKGKKYENGGSTIVSLPNAYAYFKAAADKGYPKAEAKMGEIYQSKYYPFHDLEKSLYYYKKAAKHFRQLSDRGDAEAAFELACLCQQGVGVDQNADEAKSLFERSAARGNKDAAWKLGMIYKDEADYENAFRYLQNAAEGGQGMAMYELARFFEAGLTGITNMSEAVRWYKKCVEARCDNSEKAREALDRLGVVGEKEE